LTADNDGRRSKRVDVGTEEEEREQEAPPANPLGDGGGMERGEGQLGARKRSRKTVKFRRRKRMTKRRRRPTLAGRRLRWGM
jgi:hypothetical protein